MLLPTKEIMPGYHQFLPKEWVKRLTGPPHKASYTREYKDNPRMKAYILKHGNLLQFPNDKMIYADHLWRVCKFLDHQYPAILVFQRKGIRIEQTAGPLATHVHLDWQEEPRALDIIQVELGYKLEVQL